MSINLILKKDKQSHLEESGKNKGRLSDVFTIFITFIDYFNHEKTGDGGVSYWVSGHSRDIISFEFGCYLLSNIDYWLFAHNNQHREEIMTYLIRNFLKYFSDLLNMPQVKLHSTINNRLSLYGQLKKETNFGTDKFIPDNYYGFICDIFLNSKNEDKVREFSSINEVPAVLNFFDTFLLRTRISTFEIHLLKTFFDQIAAVKTS